MFAMSGLGPKHGDESGPPEPRVAAGTQVRQNSQLRENAQKLGKKGKEHHNISEHINT